MSLLSEQAEQELIQSVLKRADKLVELRVEQLREFPYKKKADLKRKLSKNTKQKSERCAISSVALISVLMF